MNLGGDVRRGSGRGKQEPRLLWVPPGSVDNDASEVIDLAASAGLVLDPWQRNVLRYGLGVRPDGRYTAFEVGLVVPRQNGKGSILEALELFWLYLAPDKLMLHSAHEFKTAREGFLRLRSLIDNTDDLRKRTRRINGATGEELVELLDGSRLRFVARSKGSGRGFSPDKVVLDEVFNLPDLAVDALLPGLGARPNPQVWYTSSPGDIDIAPCDQLARVRRRGIKGGDPRLAFAEWSIPFDEVSGEAKVDPYDERMWGVANPSMGYRKDRDRIAVLAASMSPAGFLREEMGVGNYPQDEDDAGFFNTPGAWQAGADPKATMEGFIALGVAVSTNRKTATIGAAGFTPGGDRVLYEVVESRPGDGTAWVADRVATLVATHPVITTALDSSGPAKSLMPALRAAGVALTPFPTDDVCSAAAAVVDRVERHSAHAHLGDKSLNASMRSAYQREVGDRFVIGRRKTAGDVSEFESVVLAGYAIERAGDRSPVNNVW